MYPHILLLPAIHNHQPIPGHPCCYIHLETILQTKCKTRPFTQRHIKTGLRTNKAG